jgi:hypothetical protein
MPPDATPEELPLNGGNITGVVRIGDTVRRAQGPWSATVHHLLLHLEQAGFAGAPRFRGIDAQHREILTFLPGQVGEFAYALKAEAVVAAARLLRRFHDATATYRAPHGAAWQIAYPDPARHEVICHNDFAPYNLVFVDRLPVAIIDFDTAGPGPRLWDVAYAIYRFAPLFASDDEAAPGLRDLPSAAARIRLFCDAYGIGAAPELLDMVEQRLHALCVHIITRALRGDAAYRAMIAEGHLGIYQQSIAHLRRSRPALDRYCFAHDAAV